MSEQATMTERRDSLPDTSRFEFGALVNDEGVLAANLGASPDLAGELPALHTERGARHASAGLNRLLDRSAGDVAVLVHQDVYLPAGWAAAVRAALDALPDGWGVAGVYGCAEAGGYAGRVWSSGLNSELRGSRPTPDRAVSLDELLIIVNRRTGLRFDDQMPGFHLYGTDIVQTALARGLGAYVIEAPVVHNSNAVRSLDRGYRRAYQYMQRKWGGQLPIRSCVATVDRFGVGLWRTRYRLMRKRVRSRAGGGRVPDPREIARRLGYEGYDESVEHLAGAGR